jgi:hypothetical protein
VKSEIQREYSVSSPLERRPQYLQVRGGTPETAHLHNLCLKGRTSSVEHDEDFSQIKALIMSQKNLGLHELPEAGSQVGRTP